MVPAVMKWINKMGISHDQEDSPRVICDNEFQLYKSCHGICRQGPCPGTAADISHTVLFSMQLR